MSPRILATLAAASVALAVAGCTKSDAPAPAPAATTTVPTTTVATTTVAASAAAVAIPTSIPAAMPVAPTAQPGQLVVQGYAGPLPAGWVATAPSSSMRVAQFALPAPIGVEPGELAAFFFAPGQGGSHEANIERWASQFSTADGQPGKPKVETFKAGESAVTLVELRGSYARGVGMGPSGDAKPDQRLMVAMIETAGGRITLQMYGPAKTVDAQRAAFLTLARGFRRIG
jgi:hypothetical protein